MQQFSLNEVVELAVQIERNGYAFYNEALKRKDLTPDAHALLTELRDQELNHEKIFSHLRDEQDMTILEQSPDWELVGYYMKAMVDSRIYNSPEAAIRHVNAAKGFIDILLYAIAFEKDTLLFFYTIYDNITIDKSRKIIHEIINEEISHVVRLTEYHAKG